jgi:hypothetical protein
VRLIISDHENIAEFVASVRNCMDVKTLEVLKLNPFSRTEVSHMFLHWKHERLLQPYIY